MLKVLFALALATLSAVCADAQTPTVRIRGQVEAVDGTLLTIKARDGAMMKVKLADNARVAALVKASIKDIRKDSFIGISGVPQPDGSTRALAIHIFAENQRGVVPDRKGPWDLAPQATMTNAYVESTVAAASGDTLQVKYQGGESKIAVAPDTPIVAVASGERGEIKPGAQVIIMGAAKQDDGSLSAASIYVGRGVTPPM